MHLRTPNQGSSSDYVFLCFCPMFKILRQFLLKIIRQKTDFQKVWLAYVCLGNRESLIIRDGKNVGPKCLKVVFIKMNAKKRFIL